MTDASNAYGKGEKVIVPTAAHAAAAYGVAVVKIARPQRSWPNEGKSCVVKNGGVNG